MHGKTVSKREKHGVGARAQSPTKTQPKRGSIMFLTKTIGCRHAVSAWGLGNWRSAKVIALVIATGMLSLSALGASNKGVTPPNTPGNFRVTAVTDDSASFAWTADSPERTGSPVYEIYNDTTGLIFNVGSGTSYTWSGLQAGYTYSFHIIAVLGDEGSPSSPEVEVAIPGAPPPPPAVQPAAPVITQTSATTDTITVTWTESTPASEIGLYEVLVNGIENGSSSASSTTATATGLSSGTAFTIKVVAFSQSGETGAVTATSAPVTVTTATATNSAPPAVLTAPTDLTGAGDGGGEAIISWNPSTSKNEPQQDIVYNIYINGILDVNDSTVGQTLDVYIFPRGATLPAQVYVVAVDNLGNVSAPSNVLILNGF
jgi:hypothetical protein